MHRVAQAAGVALRREPKLTRYVMTHRLALLLVSAAALAQASAAGAQYPDRAIWVHVAPAAPSISEILLRGDSAFFRDPSAADGGAYVFNRRTRSFARVRAPEGMQGSLNIRTFSHLDEGMPLVDSLALVMVELPDGNRSHVVRVAGKRTIGLRGVRVAAEQRWRRARGLSPTPEFIDEAVPHAPEDWSPVDVMSFAVDSAAVWLGLYWPEGSYHDFALGGLMRLDRRTHGVSVVADTSLMHASIRQIVADGKGGYLLQLDGTIARFDTSTRRSRRVAVPVANVQQMALANDTLFIAGASEIAVMDLQSNAVVSRGFRLELVGDSAVYALVDSTVEPSLAFRAALGVAEKYRIAPLGAWMRAALPMVKPVALEYFFPGDRQSLRFALDSTGTAAELSVYTEETLEGPTGLYVDNLTHPALRPFLRGALRYNDMYGSSEIVGLLVAGGDTGAAPYIRAVLDSTPYPYSADVARALAMLGDSTGFLWIRRALVDSMRPSASGDPNRPIHHFVINAAGAAKDPANVPRLIELLIDPRYSGGIGNLLRGYHSPEILERALSAAARAPDPAGLRDILGAIAADTSALVMAPGVRDSARAIARRLMRGTPPGLEAYAAEILTRYADVQDFPVLIEALGRDTATYSVAVQALVQLAGTGVDAMPVGIGTPATRAAARRWWTSWYERSRGSFVPASRDDGVRAAMRMRDRLQGIQ